MRMRHFIPVLIALLIPAMAQAITVKTVAGPSGVETWLSEEHALPMIAVSIALPAGAAYDPAGKPGLAALTASLLDEGAGDLPAGAFRDALDSRAILIAATPERDYLVVTLTVLKENADEGFRLLALALAHPRFDNDAIQRMRASKLAELKEDDEDPSKIAEKAWSSAYFGNHPYAHPVSGTPAGIAAITAADIKSFAAGHWVRDGVKVAVSGDINEAQLNRYLQQVFSALPARAVPAVAKPTVTGKPGTQIIPMDEAAPVADFGFAGPMRADADFIPTFVANYIFAGGGFSSRLMDQVRDKRGLTYGIAMGLDDFRADAIITGDVQSQKSKIASAIDVTKAEMTRFARDGATAEELADAKTYLTGSFPLQFDSNAKIARNLNAFQRSGLTADYVEKRNALIGAVTLAQVNAMAKKYYDPARLVIVITGTPQAAKSASPVH